MENKQIIVIGHKNPDTDETIANCSSHITFNSMTQFERFKERALSKGISCGLRINPDRKSVV